MQSGSDSHRYDTHIESLSMFYSQEMISAANQASNYLRGKLFESTIKHRAVKWNSDFMHNENWKVIPIYLNYEWAKNEMRTFEHPLAIMGKGIFVELLNKKCQIMYPEALAFLSKFISTNKINYIGISILPANTALERHAHINPGNIKLHTAIYIPSSCGISCETLKNYTRVHTWVNRDDHYFFDDNQMHYAWNHSASDRYVLVLDFESDLLYESHS